GYLERVRELDRRRRGSQPPPLVFEGNAPADVTRNYLLSRLLEEPAGAEAPTPPSPPRGEGMTFVPSPPRGEGRVGGRAAVAWLGEAIAIKDPTAATFGRHDGSNLLVVGQQDEAALGLLATAVVSLAAQAAPEAARFYLVDGSPADAPGAGL